MYSGDIDATKEQILQRVKASASTFGVRLSDQLAGSLLNSNRLRTRGLRLSEA